MICPLCSSSEAGDYAAWPAFSVMQCRDCGCRFIDTTAPSYPRNAQYVHEEPLAGAIRTGHPHIQRRIRDILSYQPATGRALDIGCGWGELALGLQEKGFDCVGFDLKPERIFHLQSHFPHVTWRQGMASDLASMPERFDVLALYHVLEHVTEPRKVLANVKALAKPGALIVIEVPHVGGWESRLKGRRWHYYDVDHVTYFRTADLRRLAADLDLEVIGVRGYQHFSYPQNVFWKDCIKGALGWLGFQDVVSVFLRVK